MEIAKENYFNVRYNRGKDVLEMHDDKTKNVFKRHKFVTLALGITAVCIVANLYLIYKFFNILFAMAR